MPFSFGCNYFTAQNRECENVQIQSSSAVKYTVQILRLTQFGDDDVVSNFGNSELGDDLSDSTYLVSHTCSQFANMKSVVFPCGKRVGVIFFSTTKTGHLVPKMTPLNHMFYCRCLLVWPSFRSGTR